jgi:large subunit ribosomal protein L22
MSDETPDIENTEEEAPKPARRRSREKPAEAAPEATSSPETSNVSDEDATSEPEEEAAVEETPDDVAAEEATEVVLEADDEAEEAEEPEVEAEADEEPEAEAEEEPEAEAEAPKPRRRRRRSAEPEEEAAPPKPAPTRRRRERDPDLPPPVVRAQAKYVRSSARKARLVCDNIRGRSVEEARAILAHTPRAVARDWSKLLESAVANAEHNHELVGEDLYVKAVHADEGPTIRRFRPRAMGRATKIRKRTSHLTILLTPKE